MTDILDGFPVPYPRNRGVAPYQYPVARSLPETVEELQRWITRTLLPHVRGTDESVTDFFQRMNSALITAVASIVDGSESTAAALTAAGVDLTGANDSTAALNAFIAALPDGASLTLPSSGVIRLSDTVQLPKRIHLRGGIELRWVSGIASKPLLHVLGEGSTIRGLHITNPNHLHSNADARARGIYIETNNVIVDSCRIVGQQQAIFVEAGGEWYNHIFTNNIVLDVPGSGAEDRGDGIYSMGATCIIVGNRVELLDGTDGRIGIGLEGLQNYEQVAYKHGDEQCVIANNIVTGKFRRSITTESVNGVSIANNVVKDATWWALSVINAVGCSITDNVIRWTRNTNDNQGGDFQPSRCGIMFYGSGSNNVARGNTVYVIGTTAANAGITVQTAGTGAQVDLMLDNNDFANFPCYSGISLSGGQGEILRPTVRNNKVRGFSNYGIYAYNAGAAILSDNDITGSQGTKQGEGVHVEATITSPIIDGNRIGNVDVGVRVYNTADMTQVNGNNIEGVNTGIDSFGVAGATMSLNRIKASATKIANAPAGAIMVGNN